ncbi:MAG: hypothetical protein U0797_18770 [Gemmataceae bacterium]
MPGHAYALQAVNDKLIDPRQYIRERGEGRPQICRGTWPGAKGAAATPDTAADNV